MAGRNVGSSTESNTESNTESITDQADPGAAAAYRRLLRAFSDLGLVPVSVDSQHPTWVRMVNGHISFGDLSVAAASRMASAIEDLVNGRAVARDRDPWELTIDTSDHISAVVGPFTPVAAPLTPARASSQYHPSIGS
jgi:hypothetical protein